MYPSNIYHYGPSYLKWNVQYGGVVAVCLCNGPSEPLETFSDGLPAFITSAKGFPFFLAYLYVAPTEASRSSGASELWAAGVSAKSQI